MSQTYYPDRWVLLKISRPDVDPIYKLFSTWFGGYCGSESWKINSGVKKITQDETCFFVEGYSESVYSCDKHTYGTNLYTSGVLSDMIENAAKSGVTVEILPEDTDFVALELFVE